MADDLIKDLGGANAALSKMVKLLEKLTESAGKFSTTLSGGLKNSGIGTNGGVGQIGIGSSGGQMMPSSLGNISSFLSMNRRMNMGYGIAQGAIKFATGVVAGGLAAAPDLASTTARSMGFYDAGTLTGQSRTQVMNATMRYMSGGISSQGGIPIGDVQTANIFAAAGISANTTQFANLATSVGNAQRYLNVNNAQAAQSMSALTQGGMSSNLMRNFGVYTTDPRTGRRLSPSEIYNAVSNRITGGQKLSAKDIMTSMQGGALAVDLAQIGDQTTQDMVYRTMLANASDSKTNGLDLGSQKSVEAFAKANGLNPGAAGYSINTSQASTMNAASDAYIKGMQDAAGALGQFHDVLNGIIKSPVGQQMLRMSSMADTIASDPSAGGAAAGIGGALGGLGQIGGALLQNALLKRTLQNAGVTGGGVKPKGATWKPGGKGGGGQWVNSKTGKPVSGKPSRGFKGGRSVGVGLAANLLGDVISGGAAQGSVQSKLGGALSGAGTGLAIGAAIPILDATGIPEIAGAVIGGLIGGFSGGTNSTVGSSPMSDTTGGIKLTHPVGRARITCKYGQKDSLHSSGHHGVDFGVAAGTNVIAAADGVVAYAGGSAANTMGTNNFSLGVSIEIRHANGYSTVYGHLSSYGVTVGDTVKASQIIAKSGNSGYSTGPHLHFELRKNGNPIDPSAALGGNYSAGSGSYTAQAENTSGSIYAQSNSSSGSSGAADALGYSSGAQSAGGLSIPPSYSGAGSGSVGVAQASKMGSAMIGHGVSTTTTGGASIGNTVGGGTPGGGNNVVINVSVAQASESEARRFASMIKQYIDDDHITSSMGRM